LFYRKIVKNTEISNIFREIAAMLEIKGENVFRIRAYERAALNIESLNKSIEEYNAQNLLRQIPGIGSDLEQKIKEYLTTGHIKSYEELKRTLPEGVLELLQIQGIGPKTAKLLFDKLSVKSLADLEKAIKDNRLVDIEGIKEKTVQNIIKSIETFKKGKERLLLHDAMLIAEEIVKRLKQLKNVKIAVPAGSLRRKKETVGDIDILAVSDSPSQLIETFTNLPLAETVLSKGDTKSSIRTKDGLQIDCRVVNENSFGAALLYFTGSKNFNIKLRTIAKKIGLKINEYGLFSLPTKNKPEKLLCGKTEAEIFKYFKLSFIEPELREDTGEVELALANKLPKLIRPEDIKGDLHAHSDWSDGTDSIEKMSLTAKNRGYSYLAVTDHSQSLKVAGGMKINDLIKKKEEIDRINKKLKNFKVLFGTEVDIDSEGNLDYSDEILQQFDIVVAAIHTGFKNSKTQITKRLTRACRSKYVHIIAHPTGRLLGTREAYEIDISEIFKAAVDTNTALEINSFPQRLDLNDLNCRGAKEMGVKLAINTDAHNIQQLELMELGISVARRGWVEAGDVLNTLELDKLLKSIAK